MLDPNDRQLYINALRPPFGFEFDRAVATTYTLNLLTLLAVPLSFAKFEVGKKEEIYKDPISILEATRRMTGRFYVFCQNGAIKVPASPNPLFNYLEDMIIEVLPPNPEGVFHPKIWVLRFIDKKGKGVFYRFLCLSRNITFDKSWDTILTLEGEVKDRLFARNRALSDFINALPGLAKKPVKKRIVKNIDSVAEEIRHVDFKAPSYYDDFRFWPLGISGYHKFPIREDYWRMLVVSPFVTNSLLQRLANDKSENILVSRNEELDLLKPETLKKFKSKYVLDEAAGEEEDIQIEISSEAAKKSPIDEESDLSGLHAKLFLAELGWDAYLWTGSANATNAAFDNCNVEFMVELKGKKSRVGINKFIYEKNEEKKGPTTFMDLLREYIPPENVIDEDEAKRKLKKQLERLQRSLAKSALFVKVSPSKSRNYYNLELHFSPRLKFPDARDIEGLVWPISLRKRSALSLKFPGPFLPFIFNNVCVDKITGLFAIELNCKPLKKTISFVLNLPVKGMPTNRDEKIMQMIVSNQENFLRYLLLLLYEGEYSYLASDIAAKIGDIRKRGQDWSFFEDMPLFEELVRAYSRSPEKIKRISKLITDISKTEEGSKIIPDEFKDLWASFQAAKGKI